MKDLKDHLARIAFCIFGIKVLAFGANWPTAIAFGITAGVFLVAELVGYKKQELVKFEHQIKEYEHKIGELEKKVSYLSDSVSAIQISRGFQKIK